MSEETKIDDGGPAFPDSLQFSEMTIRDYFASQALANSAVCHSCMTSKERAEEAYRTADAMLKARKQ